MKHLLFYRFLGIFCLIFFSFSCSSDLDFNQTKKIKLEPVYEANLVYFDIPAREFVINEIELPGFPPFGIAVSNTAFIENNLAKADLNFEIDNTIPCAYSLEVSLRNASGTVLDVVVINVPAYTGVPNVIIQKEMFADARLNILKNTTKVEVSLRKTSGTTLSSTSLGALKMRSSLTAHLTI